VVLEGIWFLRSCGRGRNAGASINAQQAILQVSVRQKGYADDSSRKAQKTYCLIFEDSEFYDKLVRARTRSIKPTGSPLLSRTYKLPILLRSFNFKE